ncbi:hypothetical protein [Serratia rubidaea]|uniref:Uncharacterized protein n=1 Tax=Serratia rubidaea TaxID=61652 RepID=A0ABS0M9G9_SERRU|nr:hypothetical protein [Serratia rubidaea]MBH1929004.1 hypothetical protein [Serratia rubidaea]MEB7588228.1 hypothetical protein [Serratia rubidaea]
MKKGERHPQLAQVGGRIIRCCYLDDKKSKGKIPLLLATTSIERTATARFEMA